MKALLLLPLLLLADFTPVHDFHVSRTRIEYGAEQSEWQITLHLFIDDLELALEEKGSPKLYLGTKREDAAADEYVRAYLEQYVKLFADDTRLEWQWLGKELSEDLTAFWIYLYVPDAKVDAPLRVQNKLFFDLYDDQQNMIQVADGSGRTKSYLFHQDYWDQLVTF